MENKQLWQYRIALQFLPHIGNKNAKNLIAYAGGVEQIFKKNAQQLLRIPGIGKLIAETLPSCYDEALRKAEQELEFIEKYKITPVYYSDPNFPRRLLECADCPIILYTRGNFDLSKEAKYLAVVGTRHATSYGRDMTEKVISELAERHQDLVIISGLAFGIDITAHRKALELDIPTLGVMGTGFDTIYPKEHKNTAVAMMQNGGLITEFTSNTPGDKKNFVMRNRIIAGLADAVLVSESAEKGGSLITADLALSYNRDVFAIPARIQDKGSAGCNKLIKCNKAALVESGRDIEYQMNWESNQKKQSKTGQPSLFSLSPDERKVYDLIQNEDKISLDVLVRQSHIDISTLMSMIIELEFKGFVRSLPGNRYVAL